ncbi:MAG: hypothetical protein Q8O34_00810 [Rhodocyclaceae bacterium]|nr:hypothetical protein [Rhodocyclaceae bacterium]
MNAPETRMLESQAPRFMLRQQPARFGWWSDRTLMIVKGEETMTLDGDDLRGLIRFFGQVDAEGQP